MAINPNTSLASFYIQMRDGMLFRESFEDAYFTTDNNWNIVQGYAEQTTAQSVDVAFGTGQGLYSMALSNFDISNSLGIAQGSLAVKAPCIYQTISDTNQNNTMIGVWYYDTGIVATGTPGPYLKIQLATGQYIQMGVRNTATSGTTHYVAGGPAQDVFGTILTPKRNVGWNLLQLQYQPVVSGLAGCWIPYMASGNVAPTQAGPILVSGASNIISNVYLNGDIPGTNNDSFGYWDECHLNRDQGITFFDKSSSNNRNFYIYSNNPGQAPLFNFTASAAIPSGQTSFGFINDFVQPANLWAESSQADGTTSPNSLEGLLYLSQAQNGDYYQFMEVDTKHVVKTYDDMPNTILQTNKAPQGQVENIVTGQQDKITFLAHKLEGFDPYSKIQQFYQNARYSLPFSMAIQSTWAACAPVTAATMGTSTITVGNNLGVAANNIQPNYWYVLGDIFGQYRQYVFVTAVNGSTVTIKNFLDFSITPTSALFFLRHTTYYDALMLTDTTKLGLKIISPAIPRFDWQESCMQYIYR